MRKGIQRALCCRCGNEKILALGLCATCYTLKRQDEEYFGGLREAVLQRDDYCCRVCGASGKRKRSIVVHHRVPGRSYDTRPADPSASNLIGNIDSASRK